MAARVTKQWILEELKKPIPPGQSIITDVLRERLGIPKNSADNEWQELCRTVEELVEDKLVSINPEDRQRTQDYGGRGNPFLWENATISYHLRITSQGEIWLAQLNSSNATVAAARSAQVASGNINNNKTQIGLLNIGSIFNVENLKFKGSLLGGKRTKAQMELGVIIIFIELAIYGILSKYFPGNQILVYITVVALLITVVIFFGAENLIKNMQKS